MITEEYISINNVLPLASASSETFDAPVDDIFSIDQDENGVLYGQLMSAGNLYNYAASDTELGLDYQPKATAEINDYANGFLEGLGVHTDSIEPYEWARGYLRLDVKCKTGTPCGGACLPKGHKCRKGMSKSAAMGVKQTRANLRSGDGKKVAGATAALAGVAAVGAAGYVGYKNKNVLSRGGKAVSERLKRAGTEGYGEIAEGVTKAKKILKEADKNLAEAKRGLESMPKDMKDLAVIKGTTVGTIKGAGVGGATGAVAGSVEQATVKIGKNLKAAGEDIIKTAKAVGRNTVNTRKNRETTQEKETSPTSSNTLSGLRAKERRAISGNSRRMMSGSSERRALPAATSPKPRKPRSKKVT